MDGGALAFTAKATAPTVTMPRIKALTTGKNNVVKSCRDVLGADHQISKEPYQASWTLFSILPNQIPAHRCDIMIIGCISSRCQETRRYTFLEMIHGSGYFQAPSPNMMARPRFMCR